MRKHIHLGYGKCCHKRQVHLHHGGSAIDDGFHKIHHGGVIRPMDGEGHHKKRGKGATVYVDDRGLPKISIPFGRGAVKKQIIQPLKFK